MCNKVFSHKFIKAKKCLFFVVTIFVVLFAFSTLLLTHQSYKMVDHIFSNGWFLLVIFVLGLAFFFRIAVPVFEVLYVTKFKALLNKRHIFGSMWFILLSSILLFLRPKEVDIVPIINFKVLHLSLRISILETLFLVFFFCVSIIAFRFKELFEKEVLVKKEREENGLGQENQGYHHPKKSVLLTAKLAFLFSFFLIFCLAFILLVLLFCCGL